MIVLLIALIFYSTFILVSAELFVNNTLFIGWQFFTIYVVTMVLFLMKYRKKTFFNPEFLFFIIFLFCTYLYLPLLYDTKINSFIFNELANETNLNLIRSQSIAILSILLYMLGAIMVNRKKIKDSKIVLVNKKNRILIQKKHVFHAITTVIIVLSMLTGGWKILFRYKENTVGLEEIGVLFGYITIFLVISTVIEFLALRNKNVNTWKNIIKNISRLYLFNLVFMVLLYTVAGYRSAVFPLLLPVVFLYDIYIKKISKVVVISMVSIAFVLMAVMKETRTGTNEKVSDDIFSLQYLGGDFNSANKAMYFLIDYTDKHGSQQGQNAIMHMVSFIPFAQSALINFFGFQPTESSSTFFTEGLDAFWGGLGTHVIGDLYYTFGLFGTLLCMFMLGLITNLFYLKTTNGRELKIWEISVYVFILGNSLMFSRVEFFYLVQQLGFSMIVLWLFQKVFLIKS